MAYTCYIRAEGKDIVEIQPIVTIQFDQLTTITRNRLRRVFQDNYCPFGWSSKPHAILTAMQGHYRVFQNLLSPAIMQHSDFDQELFAAKARLLDFEFTIQKFANPKAYRNGFGFLQYKGNVNYDKRGPINARMEKVTENTLLPIARKFIDHNKLAPIMDALERRKIYKFAGVNMR